MGRKMVGEWRKMDVGGRVEIKIRKSRRAYLIGASLAAAKISKWGFRFSRLYRPVHAAR